MREGLRRILRGSWGATSSRPPTRDAEQMPSHGSIAVRCSSSEKGLWELALDKLSEPDREIVLKYSSDSDVGEAPDALFQAAKRKRALCEEKKWRFLVNGHTVTLRDQADKVIQWLDKMKSIGDVAAASDPVHAGLPWAGVRVLLMAATSESQLMGSLLVGLDRVLYLLNRCKVYELLYPYDIAIDAAYQNFLAGLVDLYALILQFLVTAIRVYEKNTARRTFEAFWSPDCIGDFDARFQAGITRVDIEAQNCERLYSQTSRQMSLRQEQDLRLILESIEKVKNLHGQVHRIYSKVQDIWQSLDDEKRSNALLWISKIPFEDHHRFAREGRTPNTGGWLLEHETYMKWQSSKQSRILWLHGIPGAGKTKLVSRIIDHLSNSDQKLMYFYCNRNEVCRRKPEEILRSFVKQLSVSEDQASVHRTLLKTYEARLRNGFSSLELSLDETMKLLEELVSTYPRATFVLDALDEADEVSRKHLLKWLNALVENLPNAKVFISSRRDDDIKRQLERRANVGIEATDNAADIAKFVKERIRENEEERAYPIPRTLRTEIAQVLLDKSGGMFQWVALQITEVLSLKLECEIRERLGRLPEDLKDAYDEIFHKIQRKKGVESIIANRAFQWVMCSQAPLSPQCLVAAVSQDAEDEVTREPIVDTNFILGACCNLLIVDDQGICRLSHLSVREYLEDHRWSMDQCLTTLLTVCLTLLLDRNNLETVKGKVNFPDDLRLCFHYRILKGLDRSDEGSGFTPLQNLTIYAARLWPAHMKTLRVIDDRLFGLVERFLGSPSNPSDIFVVWANSGCDAGFDISEPSTDDPVGALPFICELGLSRIFSRWAKMGKIDFGQLKDRIDPLLLVSIMGGSAQIVQCLIANGANVNRTFSDAVCGSMLEAAAGCPEIVKILLDAGADANAQSNCGNYGSALAAAAVKSNDSDAIGLLLDAGADPNALLSAGHYGSALAAASTGTHGDKVRKLLEAGAHPNGPPTGQIDSCPLTTAARWGSEANMKLLLENGADVNTMSEQVDSRSALIEAVMFGKMENIQLLLDAGAEVNPKIPCGSIRSPLIVGVRSTNKTVIQLLLKAGADPNTQILHGTWPSPLATIVRMYHKAAPLRPHYMEIIRMLLDAGADVDLPLLAGEHKTALGMADAYRLEGVLELFRSKRARG